MSWPSFCPIPVNDLARAFRASICGGLRLQLGFIEADLAKLLGVPGEAACGSRVYQRLVNFSIDILTDLSYHCAEFTAINT